MNKKIRKPLTWAVALLATLFMSTTMPATASTQYGLAPSIQEGVILHCFDWTYAQITAELENIAEAGFTTVQTSPAQYPTSTTGSWYWLYQPLGFYLSDSGPLGTSAELEELCTKAHELGMFVIVDVVANHLCGDHTYIQSDLTDSQYWHTYGSNIDYSNRYAITHGDIGMQDLATENSYVQSCVKSYLTTLLELGVDGFRWDAAKHICLPSETESSQFWPTMTTNLGVKTLLGNEPYHYGEILSSPVSGDWSLFGEYANYIDFTDDEYGNNVLSSFNSGSAYSSYCRLTSAEYIDDDNVVYWAESHDTYSNDGGSSTSVGTNVIDRTWAVVASRNNIPALYFSRPTSSSINMSSKGSTHFTSAEVAAVNHFHNATNGQADYFVYDSSSNVNAICREGGAVIVLGSGSNTSVSVTNGGSYTTPGTYTDEISGNTFTVTSSTISGTVGSTGIAVFYTDSRPTISFDPDGGSFTSETLSITATLENATSGTLTVGSTTYSLTSSSPTKTFTIGSDMDYGESIVISWTATSSDETVTGTETYTKKDPNATITIYCNSSSSSYYMYVWDSDNNSLTDAWPGDLFSSMSSTTINGTTYYYETFDVDEVNVIFNTGNGGNQTDDITGITEDTYFTYSGGTSATQVDVVIDSDDDDDSSSDTDEDTSSSSSVTYYLACDANDWLGSTTSSDDSSSDSGDTDDSGSTDDSDDTTEGITIYVSSTSSSYYLYAWDSSNNPLTDAWPGMQFSSMSTTTVDGTTYYYYTFTGVSSVNVIFNTGNGGSQTSNIEGITEDTYFTYSGGSTYGTISSGSSSTDDSSSSSSFTVYVNSSSSSYYMYAWDVNNTSDHMLGDWPGTQLSNLSTTTVDGTTYYYYTFTGYSTVGVIFNTGNNGSQTGDINVSSDSYFTYSGGSSYTTSSAAAKKVLASSSTTTIWCSGSSSYYLYAWDSNNSALTSTWPGDQFSSLSTKTVNGTTYYGTTFSTSPVSVIFNTGNNGSQTGDISDLTGTNYFSYSGGTSATVITGISELNYDSDYAFTEASDGTLVLELSADLFGTTGGFKIFGDDGNEYSYGGSVPFETEYAYAINEEDATYLSTSASNSTITFVITATSAGTSVTAKVVDGTYVAEESDDTTGISTVATEADGNSDGAYYTIQGVRLSFPTTKGVYIHNGKKIIVR